MNATRRILSSFSSLTLVTGVLVFTVTAATTCLAPPTTQPSKADNAAQASRWIARAAKEAQFVNPPVKRAALLDQVFEGQLLTKDLDAKTTTLRASEELAASLKGNPAVRAMHLAHLAMACTRADDKQYAAHAETAHRLAEKSDYAFGTDYVRKVLYLAYTRAGNRSAAQGVFEKTQDPSDRFLATSDACKLLLIDGQRTNYDTLIPMLRDQARASSKDGWLNAVAMVYLKAEDTDAARDIASGIKDAAAKADTLAIIATRAKQAEEVRLQLDNLIAATGKASSERQVRLRITAAGIAREIGDADTAALQMREATAAAEAIPELPERYNAHLSIADDHAVRGDLIACRESIAAADRVREHAEQQEEAGGFNNVWLAGVAQSLATSGHFDEARQLADRLEESERPNVYFTIACHLARVGRLDEARNVQATQLARDYSKEIAARSIAGSYAEHGKLEEIEKWLTSLETPAERANAYIGVAEELLDKPLYSPLQLP